VVALCLPQEPHYFSGGSSQYVLESEEPIEEIKKIGFSKPKQKERMLPLIQKPHKRISTVGKNIISKPEK